MTTIRELRKRAGLTQAELARKLGVSSNALWHWEVGRRKVPRHLKHPLAEALDNAAREQSTHALDLTRIRELRKRAGLTQAELARRVGVDHGTVCIWETGRKKPSPHNAIALAQALSVDASAAPAHAGDNHFPGLDRIQPAYVLAAINNTAHSFESGEWQVPSMTLGHLAALVLQLGRIAAVLEDAANDRRSPQ